MKTRRKNSKKNNYEVSHVIGEKEDVCGVCGTVNSLDDMWVLVKTKHEAMNICSVCKGIYDISVKDFSALVYNNRGQISARVGKELFDELKKKFNPNTRLARLWSKIRKKKSV